MTKKNKNFNRLHTWPKNDQEKKKFHHWYPWSKKLKNQRLSPLVTLAKND